MAVHPCNHSTRRQRQALPEFEVSMIYIASSRLVGGLHNETLSQNKNENNTATNKFCILRAKMPTILNFTVLALFSTLNVNNAPQKTIEQFHLKMKIH